MTSFWSAWIIVLTVFSLIACFWIITVNLKNYTHVDEGESMGHEFDGIEELNNPMPKWWVYLFYFLLAWSVGYLALYPGLGNFKGMLGWESSNQGIKTLEESRKLAAEDREAGVLNQLERENIKADETFGPIFKAMSERPIIDLAYDSQAVKVGQRLYLQNCALCHGSDARGSNGFPDLTDSDWLYDGSPEGIKETLMHGRTAQGMLAWESVLGGDQGVKEMTAYVLKLAGRKVNDKDAEAGKAKFALCAACHGADGKGGVANGLATGAPNLTDNIWLYGGSSKAVEESIRNGRAGVMPAWKDILGEDKVHVISAYVYRISHPSE
jgi:cytochrome c oxidase cbb3-type subunit 3